MKHIIGTAAFIAGLAVILLTFVALAGCGSTTATSGGQQPAATTPATQPPTTSSPPAQPDIATCPQQVTSWWNADGRHDIRTVQRDMTAISRDAAAQDAAAVEEDGAKLAADATRAQASPPPGCIPGLRGDYRHAMHHYQLAGRDMSYGLYAAATRQLQLGTADISSATADIKSYGSSLSL